MGKSFVPVLVCVQEDLVLGHLLLCEVVTLVHLANKVEGFGFVGDDDIDPLAFFSCLVSCWPKVTMWVMLGTHA